MKATLHLNNSICLLTDLSSYIWIVPNETEDRINRETEENNPQTGNVRVRGGHISSLTDWSTDLCSVRVLFMTTSMRCYLHAFQVAQTAQFLQDETSIQVVPIRFMCLPAHSQKCVGDSRRPSMTQELDSAAGDHQNSSKITRELPNHLQQATGEHVSAIRTDSVRVEWGPEAFSWGSHRPPYHGQQYSDCC